MCGIAGFLEVLGGRSANPEIARGMAERIAHRGPDDSGVWGEGPIALGHRRLSILDLSSAGHQPMQSACCRYVLSYNGEIYNYRELRRELEVDSYFSEVVGHWRGHSDTEVMLAAIGSWGVEKAFRRLVGMFALALWDRQDQTLYLARDRMGEKPLYYGQFGSTFLFGSELKALGAHPDFRAEIDRGALSLLMRHNYIPAPYSIYQNVCKVPPGSFLRVSNTGDRQIQSFWSLATAVQQGIADPFVGTDQEATDALEAQLRRSIRDQMESDVPLGAFLSGGIDSSVVVALMQAQSDNPVRTFSIGFFEEQFNEAKHAKRVAEHLGTDHTELYVTPQQARDVIPQLPSLYDEPFADSSQVPTFLVAQLARQHVTVNLSGDGGDELFCGYNRYFAAGDLWQQMSKLPLTVRNTVARSIACLSPSTWNRLGGVLRPLLPARYAHLNIGDKLHKLASILGAEGQDMIYRQLLSHWQDPSSLIVGGYEPLTAITDPRHRIPVRSFVERMMYLDAISYLPDDILVKVDRAAMGVSLETRVPLLDHRVVEFAWTLPLDMKVRKGNAKWLLKQVLYRYVPRAIMERPKMGFGVPIDLWLRGPLRDWAEDLLDPVAMSAEGIFDPAPIREKWSQHLSGNQNWQYLLWDVLMFQAWMKTQHQTHCH